MMVIVHLFALASEESESVVHKNLTCHLCWALVCRLAGDGDFCMNKMVMDANNPLRIALPVPISDYHQFQA